MHTLVWNIFFRVSNQRVMRKRQYLYQLLFVKNNFMHFSITIPDGTNGAGLNPVNIIRKYLRTLNDDLKELTSTSPLFYRGVPPTGNSQSMFINAPIGANILKKVPNFIAMKLQLPNPESYKSHSVRHTAATIGAENGCTTEQLTVSTFLL